jgi:FtsP/CotA-like multicopper oxidase with cupredoxin domain
MASKFSRRQAISYGASAVATGAIAGVLHAGGNAKLATGGRPLSARPVPRALRELPAPRVLTSTDGELAVRLTAQRSVVDMRAPRPVTTYTYDHAVPGYTWDIRPGDTLSVRLRNRLPALPGGSVAMDRPRDWTTTNLHTHGLHVSPAGHADNVFLEIPPGEDHHLKIPVPGDHPGGIFWYHPHYHGAVTQQLRAGMAGALIVRGAIDEVEEVTAARERVMVLQSIELGDDYQLLNPTPNPASDQAFFPRTRVLYTVNGVLGAKVSMYPGEVQRWRLLNAAAGTFMSLHLKRHDFHVLAWDGLNLAAPHSTDVLMMSSGNRVEVLVKAGQPGKYDLVLTPGSSQRPDIPGMPPSSSRSGPPPAAGSPAEDMPGFPTLAGELDPRTILTIEVSGHGPAMGIPTALPAWDPPILPIARRRDLAFTVQRAPDSRFPSFGVDGIAFDPARPPYRPVLGTAEEWTLRNAVDPELREQAHVFHIHTNPVKITKLNGRKLSSPRWRDTYVLTKSAGDSITFESNFLDYTGKFVEHCQVAAQEDLGMMSAVEIVHGDAARSGRRRET